MASKPRQPSRLSQSLLFEHGEHLAGPSVKPQDDDFDTIEKKQKEMEGSAVGVTSRLEQKMIHSTPSSTHSRSQSTSSVASTSSESSHKSRRDISRVAITPIRPITASHSRQTSLSRSKELGQEWDKAFDINSFNPTSPIVSSHKSRQSLSLPPAGSLALAAQSTSPTSTLGSPVQSSPLALASASSYGSAVSSPLSSRASDQTSTQRSQMADLDAEFRSLMSDASYNSANESDGSNEDASHASPIAQPALSDVLAFPSPPQSRLLSRQLTTGSTTSKVSQVSQASVECPSLSSRSSQRTSYSSYQSDPLLIAATPPWSFRQAMEASMLQDAASAAATDEASDRRVSTHSISSIGQSPDMSFASHRLHKSPNARMIAPLVIPCRTSSNKIQDQKTPVSYHSPVPVPKDDQCSSSANSIMTQSPAMQSSLNSSASQTSLASTASSSQSPPPARKTSLRQSVHAVYPASATATSFPTRQSSLAMSRRRGMSSRSGMSATSTASDPTTILALQERSVNKPLPSPLVRHDEKRKSFTSQAMSVFTARSVSRTATKSISRQASSQSIKSFFSADAEELERSNRSASGSGSMLSSMLSSEAVIAESAAVEVGK